MDLPPEIFFLIINHLSLSDIRSFISCCHKHNEIAKQICWADYILPRMSDEFKAYYSHQTIDSHTHQIIDSHTHQIIDKHFMQLSGRYLVDKCSTKIHQWVKWWRKIPIPNNLIQHNGRHNDELLTVV